MLTSVKNIAIIGASSGIGAALATSLCGPGAHLFISARRQDRLDTVAAACRDKGALVEASTLDMRHPADVENWISRIDEQAPIDLLICCAGIFNGSRVVGDMERNVDAIAMIETNLTGTIIAANSMAARMKSRGRGHIALTSSIAAMIPQADAATYSATKAGLTAYSAALRELLFPCGVHVTVIHPGHVETAQAGQQVGSLPLIIKPDAAARLIIRGLEARKAQITFPLLIAVYARLYGMMPFSIQRMANAGVRYSVRDLDD